MSIIGKLLFVMAECYGNMTHIKALALLSGGLDSILATEMILKQGIEVVAFNVKSPFCLCKKNGCAAVDAAKQLNIPLKTVAAKNDYLHMLRNPKHGYGRNMNPCVDCRIFLMKKARKYAKEIGANFIFTGEVLDERPMSQHYHAMKLIETEAGLTGKVLRPLSARLLPETEAEKKGFVDRAKLLDIHGRSRKPQIKLAKEFNITDYPCPAGGCLLTYKEYAKKIQDLFANKKRVTLADIALLRVGRHFRVGQNKIIVGRSEEENKFLAARKTRSEYYFEHPEIAGPVTILQGPKTKSAIQTAARLTAFYSDVKTKQAKIMFGKDNLAKTVTITVPDKDEVENLRVGKIEKRAKK